LTNEDKKLKQDILERGEFMLYRDIMERLHTGYIPYFEPGDYFNNLFPRLRKVIKEFEEEQFQKEKAK